MKGRAATVEAKRQVIDRIFSAWTKAPQLRLGQLLVNANQATPMGNDCFYTEDERLARLTEEFVERFNQ